MKTLWAILMLAAALAVGPRLCADDKGPGERKAEGGKLAERIQDLNLTDDQEAKIADIRKEYRPKVEEAAKDLAALVKGEVEKARGVLTNDQKTKLAAMKDEREDLREERLAERIAHLEQLEKLEEFQEERKEHVRDRKANAIMNFKDLNLTDDQKSQIVNIRREFRPKVHEAGNKLRATVREELDAILNVVKA